jgi:hypothetical protein
MMRLASMAMPVLILTAMVLTAQSPQTSDMPSPFGLQMGMTKDQIGEIKKEVSPYKFQLSTVTKPHPDLQTYVVTVTPNAGLCFIRALSPTLQVKPDGTELKSKFEDLKSQVEGIYGMPHVVDSLQADSTRTKPADWMMGLLQKERTLLARWSATDDNLPMKPTIRKIYVGAFAESKNSGYLAMEYYFDNYDSCQSEISASQ